MFRAAIIGLGQIGVEAEDSHLRAYRENPDINFVGFCDTDREKFALVLGKAGLFFQDYSAMIEAVKPDIVSVCTPVETHAQIVCDIAPYVKAIWCEKPISDNLQDAQRMIDVCHQHNVILQVNHQRRFIPVKARFSRDYLSTGTHMFDRLRELFGEYNGDWIVRKDSNLFLFGKTWVEIEYVKSQEHIFEIDCVRSKERMLPLAVTHLIACMKQGSQSMSSGEQGMKTLEALLRCKAILTQS